ncbi:peroxisomal membrane anchor protein conserved region-domain-containing protein [Thamnidium elegans]|nr:peroxisomal membrane anchor protein conserved region-domain-containing protein [Thamnidium elegans]
MSDSPKPDYQPSSVESTPAITATIPATTAVTEPQTAIVSPLREDLINSAVSFLSSANVRSADKGKKVAFLQKKGLNQAEIDEAFKRAGSDDQTSSVIPATTTNNYVS